ncbi:MAG: MBL fold metallo-hydrolase, partial [Methylocystaceae bacterium]
MSAGKKWGLTRPNEGFYMVTTPMPFPLKASNGFIAESAQGWVIIDGGVNTETNQQIWENALKDIGITWKQLSAVYLTHYHHDHLGLAGWMQRKAEIPVYMDEEDAIKLKNLLLHSAQDYVNKFAAECSRHSWSHEYQQQLAADVANIFYLLEPLPELS